MILHVHLFTISLLSLLSLLSSYMVVNGACKHKDMAHFAKYLSGFKDVHMEYQPEQQLVALQVSHTHIQTETDRQTQRQPPHMAA